MPSRRRFLLSAAVAASLAGCAGGESSTPGTTATESTSSGTTETTASAATRTTTTTTGEDTTTTESAAVDPRREPPESDAVRWRVAFDDAVAYAPSAANGRIFVAVGEPHYGTGDPSVGALAGLDAGDGTPRWATRLPAAPTSRPRADATGVYCTTGRGDDIGLHGRDQRGIGFDRDGDERWRTDPVDQFLALVALGGDRAYFGTSDDVLSLDGQTLSAVGVANGETKWSVESGDARTGRYRSGAESRSSTVLTELAGGMGVAVHDATTGDRKWIAEATPFGAPTNPVAVADDGVIVGTGGEDEAFALLELADGSERWRYAPESEDPFVPSAGAVGTDVLVGVAFDGEVFGLDPADGSVRWTLDPGGRGGSPVVADGRAYVSGGPNDEPDTLRGLDAVSGEEQWRTSYEEVGPYATVGDGLLVRGTRGVHEFVALLDANDGTERWSFETHEDLTAPVVADASVYVGSDRGIVRELGK